MTVPLSRELRGRFQKRSMPLRKGDTVRVLSGSFVGREERVAKVDRRSYRVTLDNVTLKTAEEKLKPLTLGVGHLVITRLNLSDPWRRRSLRAREEDITPEERGEAVEEETSDVSEASPPAETAVEPETSPKEEESAPDVEDAAAPEKTPRKSRSKPAKEEEP